MRSSSVILAAILLVSLVPLAGCGGGGGGGSTPGEALLKSVQALKNRDQQAYLACFFGGTEAEIDALKATYELTIAAHDFQKAITNRFGPTAWEQFYGAHGPWADGVLPDDPQAWLDRNVIKTEGDTAVCEVPRSPLPITVVRKSGVWRIHTARMFGDRDRKAETRDGKRLAKKFRELLGKVDEAGETIETLKREYEKEVQAIQRGD
jgi:hypothetical protein